MNILTKPYDFSREGIKELYHDIRSSSPKKALEELVTNTKEALTKERHFSLSETVSYLYNNKKKILEDLTLEYVKTARLIGEAPGTIKKALKKQYGNPLEVIKDSSNMINYKWGSFWGFINGTYAATMSFADRTHISLNELGYIDMNHAISDGIQAGLSRAAISLFLGGTLTRLMQNITKERTRRTLKDEVLTTFNTATAIEMIFAPIMEGILYAQGVAGIWDIILGDLLTTYPGSAVMIYFTRNRMRNI